MVSRYGELPSTVRVQCPNCGVFAAISLKYTEGDTGDYEGECHAELKGGRLCEASLLLTVTIPEEAAAEQV
jgi:hypothetical protein